MASSNSKNLNSIIIKDILLKGQKSANRLINFINGPEEARQLMGEVLDSISNAISAIEANEEPKKTGLTESADQKREISKEKRKGSEGSGQQTSTRKRIRQASTRVVTAKTSEDGQAWRKYGQKDILNSKNPRSYFRCTHKFDQGCQAQKQVQKSEEDPTIFIITYMGNHTCKNSSSLAQIIETSSLNNGSCLISFGSNTTISNNNKPCQENLMSTSFQSLKPDGEEEVLSNLTMADRTAGGDLEPIALISERGTDGGDVTSGVSSFNEYLSMDLLDTEIEDFSPSIFDWSQFGNV